MFGEPIQALNNALSGMINTLRTDAQALDSLWLSIITFDREVKEVCPLTELAMFQLPEITVACAAGNLADDTKLKELTDNVVHLDSADSATLKQFFKWVSETIEQGNKSQGTGESIALPPPPTEITLVI